jgi:hypothetical protein
MTLLCGVQNYTAWCCLSDNRSPPAKEFVASPIRVVIPSVTPPSPSTPSVVVPQLQAHPDVECADEPANWAPEEGGESGDLPNKPSEPAASATTRKRGRFASSKPATRSGKQRK